MENRDTFKDAKELPAENLSDEEKKAASAEERTEVAETGTSGAADGAFFV